MPRTAKPADPAPESPPAEAPVKMILLGKADNGHTTATEVTDPKDFCLPDQKAQADHFVESPKKVAAEVEGEALLRQPAQPTVNAQAVHAPTELVLTGGPQAFANLPREAYDNLKAINASLLKEVHSKTELHGWLAYRDPDREEQEDKAAFRIGHLVHMGLLEPELMETVVVCSLGAATKGFAEASAKAAADGRLIAQEKEHAKALKLIAAVLKHPALGPVFQSQDPAVMATFRSLNELTLVWPDPLTKSLCKARIDAVRFMRNALITFDLKTAADADPEGFGKDAANFGYLIQGSFYNDAVFYCKQAIAELMGMNPAALIGCEQVFEFIAMEKATPMPGLIGRYFMDAEQIEIGRRLYRDALNRVAAAQSMNYWPGYSTAAVPLALPGWYRP